MVPLQLRKLLGLFLLFFLLLPMNANASKTEDQRELQQIPQAYTRLIVVKQPSVLLAMYNTLPYTVDPETLSRYGRECYMNVDGAHYKTVKINWYLAGDSHRGKPWGVTNYTHNGLEYIEIYTD